MKAFLGCVLLAITLIGCSSTGPAASQTTDLSPLPTFPSIVPTPMASKGTVVGTLISDTPGTSLEGLTLFFGTMLPLTPGPDHLVNMDLTNSPKTTILAGGRFIAENLAPGDYVLLFWTPHDTRFVPDPNNMEKDFILKVVEGQITDIGTLKAWPPQ